MFWNIRNRDLGSLVAAIAHRHDLDVLILAEGGSISVAQFLRTLNRAPGDNYRFHYVEGQTRIQIYSRYPSKWVRKALDAGGVSIRRLHLPWADDVTLVAVHLPSKLRWHSGEQQDYCCRVREYIDDVEGRFGHQRTIVVGDLNMNPFEHGIVSSEGLHATMSRHVAARRKRTVAGEERSFFYNPMWRHFGERDTPPGTYYYQHSTPLCYFWNMFDQVLVRPVLLDAFPDDKLRILTSAGDTNLVDKRGRPDSRNVSDHLPIMFKLEM